MGDADARLRWPGERVQLNRALLREILADAPLSLVLPLAVAADALDEEADPIRLARRLSVRAFTGYFALRMR
jgi:hypothetical protein